MILPQSFYSLPTLQAARNLLGAVLCRDLTQTSPRPSPYKGEGGIASAEMVPLSLPRRWVRGEVIRCRIVETEAYLGFKDLASHASKGKTARNAVMFGPAGYTYVYFTYGMHYMLNIVTERKNYPAAILIRAVEPTPLLTSPLIKGREIIPADTKMSPLSLLRRGAGGEVTSGPAKLTKFLQIDKSLNNIPVFTKKYGLWIEAGAPVPPTQIVRAKRVGIDYAGVYKNKLWRFYIKGNSFVSKK